MFEADPEVSNYYPAFQFFNVDIALSADNDVWVVVASVNPLGEPYVALANHGEYGHSFRLSEYGGTWEHPTEPTIGCYLIRLHGERILALEPSSWGSIKAQFLEGKKMKNLALMLVLVLSCGIASADVIPGTLHLSDAQEVDDFMETRGVYSGRVKIVNYEGLIVYAVEFPGNYFSWDSDNDVAGLCSFFVAVANVSALTSWHSDVAIVLYENDTIGMLTEDCRASIRLMESGYDITAFLSARVMPGDRATAQLSL